MIDRRHFLQTLGMAALLAGAPSVLAAPGRVAAGSMRDRFAAIERDSGGRLGVAVVDGGSEQHSGWRDDEAFPMCSTFKFLLAAAVLRRVDLAQETLERRIPIRQEDLISNSPVAEGRVGPQGMTVAELCEAAMTVSDNAAANLLLAGIGGPEGLTRFARSLGDAHTRLDRYEPELSTAIPGDLRDTTRPRAMAGNLQKLVLGDALLPDARARLAGWLIGNRTGDRRLRAGLPAGWKVGDKTGTGANGTSNDIAVVWPADRAPLLIACYLTGSPLESAARDAVHQAVAREVAGRFAG